MIKNTIRRIFRKRGNTDNEAKTEKPLATQAAELNKAISLLHAAHGYYSKVDFMREILPMYQSLVVELK